MLELPFAKSKRHTTHPIAAAVVQDGSVRQVRSGGAPRVARNGNGPDRVRVQVVLAGVRVAAVR